MTTPDPSTAPSLDQLARISVELIPSMQWLAGLHRAVADEARRSLAELTQQQLTEEQARMVSWRMMLAYAQYVRSVQQQAPAAAEAAEAVPETFD